MAEAGYKKVLKEVAADLLNSGNSVITEVSGYSMWPSIKPGYIIEIEPVDKDDPPLPGDVVAWQRDSDFVVHRVVHRYESGDKTWYLTRGDSSPSSDLPVEEGLLAGKVIRAGREGRLTPVKQADHIPERLRKIYRLQVWFILKSKAAIRRLTGRRKG